MAFFIFLALVIISAVLLSFMGNEDEQVDKLPSIDDYVSDYLDITDAEQWDGEPYITGKIVIVDKIEQRIDNGLQRKLDKALRAEISGEVGTVIWVERGKEIVGTYADGTKGYRHICKITVIDYENELITSLRRFVGSDPPPVKVGGGDKYGTEPSVDNIIGYIEQLPLKP